MSNVIFAHHAWVAAETEYDETVKSCQRLQGIHIGHWQYTSHVPRSFLRAKGVVLVLQQEQYGRAVGRAQYRRQVVASAGFGAPAGGGG
eukprot:42248-Eustigmatos_ZCMA.PRE.1